MITPKFKVSKRASLIITMLLSVYFVYQGILYQSLFKILVGIAFLLAGMIVVSKYGK